jgi:hypothetical protein
MHKTQAISTGVTYTYHKNDLTIHNLAKLHPAHTLQHTCTYAFLDFTKSRSTPNSRSLHSIARSEKCEGVRLGVLWVIVPSDTAYTKMCGCKGVHAVSHRTFRHSMHICTNVRTLVKNDHTYRAFRPKALCCAVIIHMARVGHNRKCLPYMIVCMVISLQNLPCVQRVYV